jgi:hypothetical protein
MNNQQQDPHAGADYHGDVQISGNDSMPSGSEQPNSKRDQEFVSAQQGIESSSGGGSESGQQPNVQPSETGSGSTSGDPGRTPGKAEGEDDSSAQQSSEDVENYEQTKEKKIAESVSSSS